MTTKHREKDIESFDQWAGTYENSWLQRAFFDRAHQATLALPAAIIHQHVSVTHWLVRVVRLKRLHSPAQLRTLSIQAGFHVQTQQTLAWRRWLATVGNK